jgi:hypothetical protein
MTSAVEGDEAMSITRFATFVVLTATVLMGQASSNWYAFTPTNGSVYVSDSAEGSPTFTLFKVDTPVTFSSIYLRITQADPTTSDYYDIGIGSCPSNDCSQPGVPITLICNLGGVNLLETGDVSFPCVQGQVTLQTGVYAYLGVGSTAFVAKCQEQQAQITPFASTVRGGAVNGNLSTLNVPFFTTPKAGARSAADICAISLH